MQLLISREQLAVGGARRTCSPQIYVSVCSALVRARCQRAIYGRGKVAERSIQQQHTRFLIPLLMIRSRICGVKQDALM
jgi:hypothetical protein